eukprot:Skav235374  [mRNA]  locus=scaffold6992:22370:27106:- [translate_table: standard]
MCHCPRHRTLWCPPEVTEDKEDFLFQKGLSQSEVSEALRRALAGGPPDTGREQVMLAGFGPSVARRTSGLGIGAAFSLLWRFLMWRRDAAAARARALAAAQSAREDPERQRLKELMGALASGAEETREATASLKRSAEQQERLYQMSASDFRRKLEEAQRKKGKRPLASCATQTRGEEEEEEEEEEEDLMKAKAVTQSLADK